MADQTFCDFAMGKVVIDFRDWTQAELTALRRLYQIICPDVPEPAYTFGRAYYVKPEHLRIYEGDTWNKVGKITCRSTEIVLPFEGRDS